MNLKSSLAVDQIGTGAHASVAPATVTTSVTASAIASARIAGVIPGKTVAAEPAVAGAFATAAVIARSSVMSSPAPFAVNEPPKKDRTGHNDQHRQLVLQRRLLWNCAMHNYFAARPD